MNALYQGRQDRSREADYLELLARDLQAVLSDLQEQSRFEALQIEDGLVVYRALSDSSVPRDSNALSAALVRLGTRRTMVLKNSTYENLINTGSLTLIRNDKLRNGIVEFYESMERSFEIINKNNSFFVDDMYFANVLLSGLVLARAAPINVHGSAATTALESSLVPGYVEEEDLLWQLAAEDPRWAMVKTNLLVRLSSAARGIWHVDNLAGITRALIDEIELERGG